MTSFQLEYEFLDASKPWTGGVLRSELRFGGVQKLDLEL